MMRRLMLDLFELINAIVMSIPLHFCRKMWVKILVKEGKANCYLRHIRMHTPWRIHIGSDCVFNEHVMLDGRKGIEIGDHVDIGENVTIWTLQHDPDDNNHKVCGGKVVIENNVWIAPRSVILPGVTIGHGAVVATCSVVTKDVPPMTLVAGMPAKPIRQLKHSCQWQNNYKVYL